MSKLSLKWRSILPVAAVLLVGITLMVIVVASLFNSTVSELVIQNMTSDAESVAMTMQGNVQEAQSILNSLSVMIEADVSGGNQNREAGMELLRGLMQKNPHLAGLWFAFEPNAYDGNDTTYRGVAAYPSDGAFAVAAYIDTDGQAQVEALHGYLDQEYYNIPIQTGRSAFSEPYGYEWGDGRTVSLATISIPITVNGRILGSMGIDLQVDPISELVQSFKFTPGSGAFLTSHDGLFVSAPNSDLNLTSAYDALQPETVADIKARVANGGTSDYELFSSTLQTNAVFVNYAVDLGDTGSRWILSMMVPTNEAYAEVNTGRTVIILLGVALLALSLTFLYIIMNRTSKQLTEVDEKISRVTDTLVSASRQITSSSEQLADGGTEQAASVEETSATLNQAATSIKTTNENTRQATGLVQDTLSSAQDGSSRVGGLVSSMEDLSRSSDEISKIIKTIDDIAFQTNILAINAAVEAARAGDAGKGFAVVAEEVRSLAQKSADAAANTGEIIEHNIDLSRTGIRNSTAVATSLSDINQKIAQVSSLFQEIAAASDEQAQGIDQINNALSQIERVTQQNAAVAEENSAAAAEMQTQTVFMNEIVEDLNVIVLGSGGSNG